MLAAKSSQAEYEQMREYARVLGQYLDVYSRAKLSGTVRDNYMADNFQRLVRREPAATRFIVWAHNQHVATAGRPPTLGSRLREAYGGAYYAVGLSFNQGSFQAVEAKPKDPQKAGLESFSVSPSLEGSVDWYLAETKAKIGFVDLRLAAKDRTMSEWMSAPHPMRAIGSTYDGKNENYRPVVLQGELRRTVLHRLDNPCAPDPLGRRWCPLPVARVHQPFARRKRLEHENPWLSRRRWS